MLLDHGAPVNARQQGGWTPLFSAAARGDAELVRLFLEHGADHTLTQAEGKTPCDIAAERGHRMVVGIFQKAAAA